MPQFMTCLTNSYVKASSYSASSEIVHVLWIPKVHCHVLSSLLLVPVLSQMSPMLTLTSFFFKIHLIIFSLPCLGLCKCSIPVTYLHQNPVRISLLLHTCHKPCPSHPARCYHNFYLQTDKLFVKHPLHSLVLTVFCSENSK